MITKTIQYRPRKLVKDFHNRTERYAVIVAHRRFGKTVAAINDLIKDALTIPRKNVRVAYIAPYYRQAKAIAWDYLLEYTRDIEGAEANASELRVDFPNGSRIRLFGGDNYDAMRGLYFDSVVLDEPADFPANAWPTVIRPCLSDRKGRATFIGTPKGKNDFWEIYNNAQDNPDWFSCMFRADQTDILDDEELADALETMGEERYSQEYLCSFEAAIQGAYYAKEMKIAQEKGRITNVPYDTNIGVWTAWDLGVGDSTAIFFAQYVGKEIHIINYYENSGVGLDHYAKVLNELDYFYEGHILPHDVAVRELGTGKSRLEVLETLGLHGIEIAPRLGLEDGIQQARAMIGKCWFDQKNCSRGIEALLQYRRQFDEKLKAWKSRPLHDWTSHGADAFRYLAVGKPEVKQWAHQ